MRSEPTTSELQALATRQQQQLDTQARLIAARENRLRQVNYCCEEKKTNAKHFFFHFRVPTKWFGLLSAHCLQMLF